MGRPELHFAHANGIPSACYRKLTGALAQRFDVRAVPMIGVDPAYPIDATCVGLMDQVADSIRAQCDGPVIGVGHSLGGITTFMAAYRYPELFRAVVLLDPPIFGPVEGTLFGLTKALGKPDLMTPARRSLRRRERWSSREDARASLGGKGLFRAFDSECFEDYIALGLVDDEDGVRLAIPVATEVAIFRVTPHAWWRFRDKLRMPAALVAGASSQVARRHTTERFAKKHGLTHRVVPGGHMFPLERPIETAETIIEHVFGTEREPAMIPAAE